MIKTKLLTRYALKSTLLNCLLIPSLLLSNASSAEQEIKVMVSSGDEITIEKFPSEGKYLMLWLAPEYGLREAHRSMAGMLANNNIEVWQSDILESLFLPLSSTSIKKLDGRHVADLIEYAHKITGKKIIVVGDSYASIVALHGAHEWQRRKQTIPYLIGAILFTPNTYVSIPPLGQLPEYMPIISSTNIPIMIYQSQNSSNIGQFDSLVEKLQQHGNPVYTRLTPKIMSVFYEKEPTEAMKQQVRPLSTNIKKIIPILEKYPTPLKSIKLKKIANHKRGTDSYLKVYKGTIYPLAIHLEDAYGKAFTKNNYKGQITVINFWATWCPPCVQEIPSLNRLKNKMKGYPFELISINYAEDQKTILEFMKKVNVEFPVLLDKDGTFAKKWNVIAYPSTFVIDKNGVIKYGVNAAIEWDSPELIEKIKSLNKEK